MFSNILGWPGSDLLSRVLRHSTIGAGEFNGRVRDGIGFRLPARATGPAKDIVMHFGVCALAGSASILGWPCFCIGVDAHGTGLCLTFSDFFEMDIDHVSDQAGRAISTGQLHALLRFHIRPINVVVFHGSSGRTRFEVGFPLRCLQRLSLPYIATLQCGWRHNRSTRGTSIPVLSY